MKIKTRSMVDNQTLMLPEEEPVSPRARLFHAPGFDVCLVVVMGLKTTVSDIDAFKTGLEETFAKHPRFSSLLVMNNENKESWRRTTVNVDNHFIMPDLDPDMESPNKFAEDYTASLSTIPMDHTKPLWEFHLLNVRTSDAISTLILRVHHSMGDGESLISLLLAGTRKSSDPDSLPTFPSKKQRVLILNKGNEYLWIWRLFFYIWTCFVIVFNTLVDLTLMAARLLFLKDTKSPIKGPRYGVEPSPRRFVHRIVGLEDVKLVKNAMNVTVNDVILGVVQGGLSLYLERRYEKHSKKGFGSIEKYSHLPKDIRCTAAVLISHRPSAVHVDLAGVVKKASKGTWGNLIHYMIVPFTIALQNDPLAHIYQVKAIMDRKKLSLESKCSFVASLLLMKLFGMKLAADLTRTIFSNPTFIFSNMVGPQEELTFYGHPISYVAPSISGIPNALTMHWLSYDNKLVISLSFDENVIADPYQLCDDFVKSLNDMKDAVINKGLVNNYFR